MKANFLAILLSITMAASALPQSISLREAVELGLVEREAALAERQLPLPIPNPGGFVPSVCAPFFIPLLYKTY